MRYLLLIFPLLFALTSCQPKIQETDTASLRGQDSIEAKYLILARALPDSLGRIGPYIIMERDSGFGYEVLDAPYLAIGKLIDTTHVFALSCRNLRDSIAFLRMYRLNGEQWKIVGSYNALSYTAFLKVRNTDAGTEIILSGVADTCGIKTVQIFEYDPGRDTLLLRRHSSYNIH